jgi:hypothetical protein
MISKIEVERFRLTSYRPFDEVLASTKGAVGRPDMVEFVFFSRKEHHYANDKLEIRPGLANVLMAMSRIAPQFMAKPKRVCGQPMKRVSTSS